MPITFRLGMALRCGEEKMDMQAHTLSLMDKFEHQINELRKAYSSSSDPDQQEAQALTLDNERVQVWLNEANLLRRAAEMCPQESAALLATTGEGKSFMLDTLQYITRPSLREYQRAARLEEKEAISDQLDYIVLPKIRTCLQRPGLQVQEMADLLIQLIHVTKDYYEIFADRGLQEYIPDYLDPRVLEEIEDLEVPNEDSLSDAAIRAFKNQLAETLERLAQTRKLRPPEGVDIRPLEADGHEAATRWTELHHKFANLIEAKELGSQVTYLLRCANEHSSTTTENLGIEYSESLMLIRLMKDEPELRTQLMEVAENYHPNSPLYRTPEAEAYRNADSTGSKKLMYHQLTSLQIPNEDEARTAEEQVEGQSLSHGRPRQNRRQYDAFMEDRHTDPQGRNRSIRLPASANDIPLLPEVNEILQGPRVIIYRGANECLMRESKAVHDLLDEAPGQIVRHLVKSQSLYSPSTINKKLRSYDVPGKITIYPLSFWQRHFRACDGLQRLGSWWQSTAHHPYISTDISSTLDRWCNLWCGAINTDFIHSI